MKYELIHTDNTTIITVSVPTNKHEAVLKAIKKVLKEPDAEWFQQLKELYEDHYEGVGGVRILAEDLGVTRATVFNWRAWPRPRPKTGQIIEPTYENRQTITALWRRHFDEAQLTPEDRRLLAKARAVTNEANAKRRKKPVDEG